MKESLQQRNEREGKEYQARVIKTWGAMQPKKYWTKFTKQGVTYRVPSFSGEGHYRVVLRVLPKVYAKCSCPDFQNKNKNRPPSEWIDCKHVRDGGRQWVDRQFGRRVKALGDGINLPNADRGVQAIAEQHTYTPIRKLGGDRVECVDHAIQSGFVFENENWEFGGVNAKRYSLTGAGIVRWNQMRQEKAMKDLSAMGEQDAKKRRLEFERKLELENKTGLTNPVNYI
jgi:hypothetical protein